MSVAYYNSRWYKFWDKIITFVGNFNWCKKIAEKHGGKYWSLTDPELKQIKDLLAKNYLIIATARKCHLTTYLIRLLSFIKGSRNPVYSHVLMNVEGDDPAINTEYRLIEATGRGVHYSTFMQVFDCDDVCLLKRKNVSLDDWNIAIDAAIAELGLPYDDVFNIDDSSHVSCVEMVRCAMEKIPDYSSKFPVFEQMIKTVKNLTPQMYRDCPDFEILLEIKH